MPQKYALRMHPAHKLLTPSVQVPTLEIHWSYAKKRTIEVTSLAPCKGSGICTCSKSYCDYHG